MARGKDPRFFKGFVLGVLVCVAMAALAVEFIRDAQGLLFTSVFRYGARTQQGANFTHVSAPGLSLFTNGVWETPRCLYYQCDGKGAVQFANGGTANLEVHTTWNDYRKELPSVSGLIDAPNASAVVDSETIDEARKAGRDQVAIRCNGTYFTSVLVVKGLKDFPEDGVISIIGH